MVPVMLFRILFSITKLFHFTKLNFSLVNFILSLMTASTAYTNISISYSMLLSPCFISLSVRMAEHLYPNYDITFRYSEGLPSSWIIQCLPFNLPLGFSICLFFRLPKRPPLSGLSLYEAVSPVYLLLILA